RAGALSFALGVGLHAGIAVTDPKRCCTAPLSYSPSPGRRSRSRPCLPAHPGPGPARQTTARGMKDREIVAAIAAGDPAGLAAPPAGVGDDTERVQRRGLVRAALGGLSAGEREVIELDFRQELSGADLAAVLAVSRNQAHALALRARGRLERELGVLLVAR